MTAMVCASWVFPHPTSLGQSRFEIEVGELTELAIDLADTHGLKTTARYQHLLQPSNMRCQPIQTSIELLATSRDTNAFLADLTKFSSRHDATCSWLGKDVCQCSSHLQKRTYTKFLSSFFNLFNLDIRETFDLEKSSGSARDQALEKCKHWNY